MTAPPVAVRFTGQDDGALDTAKALVDALKRLDQQQD